ncbi:MAG TPA: hypothetical protein VHW09_17565 [Bryobacteraceae bacterium]|jgi:N-acetylglucosamine kinase-like BadF-type ATPase|nr:hypothetical protein [Bryobacteraceae bacterium]
MHDALYIGLAGDERCSSAVALRGNQILARVRAPNRNVNTSAWDAAALAIDGLLRQLGNSLGIGYPTELAAQTAMLAFASSRLRSSVAKSCVISLSSTGWPSSKVIIVDDLNATLAGTDVNEGVCLSVGDDVAVGVRHAHFFRRFGGWGIPFGQGGGIQVATRFVRHVLTLADRGESNPLWDLVASQLNTAGSDSSIWDWVYRLDASARGNSQFELRCLLSAIVATTEGGHSDPIFTEIFDEVARHVGRLYTLAVGDEFRNLPVLLDGWFLRSSRLFEEAVRSHLSCEASISREVDVAEGAALLASGWPSTGPRIHSESKPLVLGLVTEDPSA